MMLKIVVLLLGWFAVQCVNSTYSSSDISDYYWREYSGTIPSDAILGGTDKWGKPTYIGQIYKYKVGLLPATITPGVKDAITSAAGYTYKEDTIVKILCSRNHHKYRWIPTKTDEYHLLINCHLVIGGIDGWNGHTLNIGRVNHGLQTTIGKVAAPGKAYEGLAVPSNDGGEVMYPSYEILTYNCNMNHYCANTKSISIV